MKLKLLPFIALSLLPVFIARQPAGFSELIRNSALTVTRPLLCLSQLTSTSLAESASRIQAYFRVWQENQDLKRQLWHLQGQVNELSGQSRENERLQALLELRATHLGPVIVSRVISRDVTSWMEWLVIDKGTRDGIQKGMAVLTQDGLVGRVLSAAVRSARIMLITDAQSRVSARIRETRDTGVVEGMGGPVLKLKYIDREAECAAGQTVETSGLGGIYPKGLVIGQIVSVEVDKNGLYQSATVKPAAHFSKLEEVACVQSLEG